MEASVAEIHGYPLRPSGFEEPLFADVVSKRAVGEHLLEAPWLFRASELGSGEGRTARARREPIKVRRRCGGIEVVRESGRGGRRCGRGARVVEVLRRWREVRGWWEPSGGEDRVVRRVSLSDGSVVDLAREPGEAGGWFLVGVED